MDGIVPVVTSPRPPNSDRVAGLLKWFEPDPNWNGGDYYETSGVKQTLTALRVDTLTRYGMANSLAARFPTKAEADAELHRIAAAWADVFDANSLFILGRAMETFDVASHFDRIKVPVLYVLSRTDALFPPSLAPGVMDGLKKRGCRRHLFRDRQRSRSPRIRRRCRQMGAGTACFHDQTRSGLTAELAPDRVETARRRRHPHGPGTRFNVWFRAGT